MKNSTCDKILNLSFCSDVEKFGTTMTPPAGPMSLGNSSMLPVDPVLDKTPLFSQLYEAYKLDSKVRLT